MDFDRKTFMCIKIYVNVLEVCRPSLVRNQINRIFAIKNLFINETFLILYIEWALEWTLDE